MAAEASLYAPMRFELAAGADIAAGEDMAWRWELPTDGQRDDLARRLGVGEFRPVDGGWEADNLWVSRGGTWVWGGDVAVSVCAEALPSTTPAPAPDETTSSEVREPALACPDTPVVDLPNDADVMAQAERIFGDDVALGAVQRDTFGVSVEATYTVDGEPTGQTGLLSFTSDWYASGLIGTAERVGPYRTVSAADAVSRVGSGRPGQPLPLGVPDDPTAIDDGAAMPEPMTVMPEDAPVDKYPEVTDEVVVLTDVEVTAVPLTDGTGTPWSLPGYRYQSADGGEWIVISVADEYFEELMDVPEPDMPDERPVVPGGGGSSGSDPGGDVIEPYPGEGEDPLEPAPAPPEVIGLSEGEAIEVSKREGFTVRVVERDGEVFPVTMDYNPGRVNLAVNAGVVTAANVG
jgi:hypothetical protein